MTDCRGCTGANLRALVAGAPLSQYTGKVASWLTPQCLQTDNGEVSVLETFVFRPLWRLQGYWDERNLETSVAKWVRTYSYRHWFFGAVLQSTPGFILAPLLGYLLSGGRGVEVWTLFALIAALVFVQLFTFYNRWRALNGFE